MKRGDRFLRFGYISVWLLAVVINRKHVQICSEDCIHCLISHKDATFEVFITEG